MTEAQVTALTAAFNPAGLVDAYVEYAPFILAGLGILIGIGVVIGVVRKVRGKLTGARG